MIFCFNSEEIYSNMIRNKRYKIDIKFLIYLNDNIFEMDNNKYIEFFDKNFIYIILTTY